MNDHPELPDAKRPTGPKSTDHKAICVDEEGSLQCCCAIVRDGWVKDPRS